MKRPIDHLSAVVPLSLLALAVVAISACSASDTMSTDGESDSEPATVTIEAFDFQPDPMVVPAGTTIRFVNGDAIDHTVTAGTRESPTPERFDGPLAGQGATFELTLEEPGTYPYFCKLHPGPGMTAIIIVE